MNRFVIAAIIIFILTFGSSLFGSTPCFGAKRKKIDEEKQTQSLLWEKAMDDKAQAVVIHLSDASLIKILEKMSDPLVTQEEKARLVIFLQKCFVFMKTRSLRLSHDKYSFLTDDIVFLFYKALPKNLQELHLNCKNLTYRSLIAVLLTCSSLTTLLLSHCMKLKSDKQIITFIKGLPRLSQLELMHHGFTADSLELLLCAKKNLKIISYCAKKIDYASRNNRYLKETYGGRIQLFSDVPCCWGDSHCIIL